jgi:Spy/CpxP family protein refolding chaperone
MREKKRIIVLAALMVGFMALGAVPALAQDKPADNMQILVEKVRADKKLLVATNMDLTESEAKAFWPLYEKYQDELFLLRSRTVKLIKDYAQASKEMTNGKAKKLLNEFIKIDALGPKLRQGYLPKFRAILPEIKVARYYQIENKIQAALYYELARQIPLVE